MTKALAIGPLYHEATMRHILLTTLITGTMGLVMVDKTPMQFNIMANNNYAYYQLADNDNDDISVYGDFNYNDSNFVIKGEFWSYGEYYYYDAEHSTQVNIYRINTYNISYWLSSITTTYQPLPMTAGKNFSLNTYFLETDVEIGSTKWSMEQTQSIKNICNTSGHLGKFYAGTTTGTNQPFTTTMGYNEQETERILNSYHTYIEIFTFVSTGTLGLGSTYMNEPLFKPIYQLINGAYAPITQVQTEIIDVPGMLFEIIMMPWRFISIAFNLTIFPGTPYSINFTNLLAGIFAAILSIAVVKIVLKFIK